MSNPVKIFIAYSRLDGEYLEKLRKHLKPLDRNKTIRIWYDGEIVPGSTWEQSIKDNLHTADIILLLVSANSLASDYFYDKEMADALARHEREEAIVVPIILAHCAWDITELSELQALPKDGKPISDWADDSKAYTDIVRGLNKSVQKVKAKQKATAAEILQKKKEAEAERQRKIAAAQEQERLAALQRQTEETKKKQQIAAERRRKEAEEQERLRQLELQKERERLAQRRAEAEQKRLTHFKQSLLEADKALLNEYWAAAISAFEKSLQYYKIGDQPDKSSIEQNIQNARQKQREAQISALKENPKVRYGAMSLGGLLLLFVLMWGISKMGGSTISTQQKNPDTSNVETSLTTDLDSIAKYITFFNAAQVLFNEKIYDKTLSKLDSALVYQPNDEKALQLQKETKAAQDQQSEAEKLKAEKAAYTKTIQIADTEFQNKNWTAAKIHYQDASELQPKENYPKTQIKKIETELNKIAKEDATQKEKERKNQEFNRLLNLADSKYKQQQWTEAKSYYQQATNYKNTKHIKDRLSSIKREIAQVYKIKNEENYKDLEYNRLIRLESIYNQEQWKDAKKQVQKIEAKLTFLLNEGRNNEAMALVTEILEDVAHSNNANFLLVFGATLEKLEMENNKENALGCYGKALDLNPELFEAIYNTGALFYNMAVVNYTSAYKLQSYENKKYYALKKEGEDNLSKALPYFDRALEVKPNDLNILLALVRVHTRLGDIVKSKEYKKRYEILQGGNK